MKAALLVIDIQNESFNINQVCSDSLKFAIQYVNAAMKLFRKRNLPIVIVQHKSEEDDLVPDKPNFDVPDAVKIEPNDLRIVKTYGNSFNKTGLTEKLRELGFDTVIITGFCAEECILSAYKGAENLGFKPIILKGSIASYNLEHIKFLEEITEALTLGAIKKLLYKSLQNQPATTNIIRRTFTFNQIINKDRSAVENQELPVRADRSL